MVAEDRQSLGGERPGRHMEDGGCQFPRDLVHVREHQHQSLRSRESRGERSRLQCTVDGTSRTAFALHFDDIGDIAPDISETPGSPLIRQFGHRRRRGDGIDCTNFIDAVGDVGGGLVAIHGGDELISEHLRWLCRVQESFQWHGRGIARSRRRSRCICRGRSGSPYRVQV